MGKDWSEVLPRSSTELVSLNTMVPRWLSEEITQCKGLLQTTSTILDYTKQATVQVLLERGVRAFKEDYYRQDEVQTEEPEEPEVNEKQVTIKAEESEVPATKGFMTPSGLTIEGLNQIGNKATTRTTLKVVPARVPDFARKLVGK